MSLNIMIDLETLGTVPGCGILSIGAVSFDEKYKFYSTISRSSCSSLGLHEDPETIKWWKQWWNAQTSTEIEATFSGTKPIRTVLTDFAYWLHKVELSARDGKAFIWSNGADFDLPILRYAYKALDLPSPWTAYRGRCYRTYKNLPENKEIKGDETGGTKHNALDDAIFQARHMTKLIANRKERGIE